MTSSQPQARRGVVAVIQRSDALLVIRRSQQVVAPGALCFPGGAIEAGETEPTALIRELNEELGVTVKPQRRMWRSTTPWQVEIAWWSAFLPEDECPIPNPAEVESVHWMTHDELRSHRDLLASNLEFLDFLDESKAI